MSKHCSHQDHKKDFSSLLDEALAELKNRQCKITIPRKLVLSALIRSPRPLSCEEILKNVDSASLDLVTIYRTVALFEEMGLVNRADYGDSIKRVEFSSGQHHHHYIRCTGCGSVEPFGDCNFEKWMAKALAQRGYSQIRHSLDVLGLCKKCA